MPESIEIPDAYKARLIAHADAKAPHEACALLLGTGSTVRDVILTDNASSEPTKFFTISTGQLLEAYKTAQKKGLEVIGVFHSHPTSEARPSMTDIKFMSMNPVTWIIYSGTDRNMLAYLNDANDNSLQDVSIM